MILWFSFQISLVYWVVYRKATYFIFTLNPATLLKSLVLGFFFSILSDFILGPYVICEQRQFYVVFPSVYIFYFLF